RDARGLAVQVLVGDQVADDDERPAGEAIDERAEPCAHTAAAHRGLRGCAPSGAATVRPASTQSTASSRSPATWSGATPKSSRWCGHWPGPSQGGTSQATAQTR